jgi:endonuclease/exonuclease/phosphatase family metal-dependent hydrolase
MNTVKVLTLNLRHEQDRWPERFPLVVDVLRAENADVIGLQEVSFNIRQAHLIADALNADGRTQPYQVYVEAKWRDDLDEGVGVLTRLPAAIYERIDLPEGGRVAQHIGVEVGGQILHLINTHLHHRPMENESIRYPQMLALLAKMFGDETKNLPWILCGDLNSLKESETIQEALKWMNPAHSDTTATFPTPLRAGEYPKGLALMIDYILYTSSHFRLLEARRTADNAHPDDPTLYPSDHYGLVAVLEVV